MQRILWLVLAALAAASGGARADETADFGVAPTAELRLVNYAAPTPREVPGAKTILTPQLRAMLERDESERPLLLDVIGDQGHDSLPGAIWMPGAGRGLSFEDSLQGYFGKALEQLAKGDRSRAMVFFCAGNRCWLSYNAALRAARLGYTEVYWYRGGIDAWITAGGRLAPIRTVWRKPPPE
jgi:PQQ-dependent catabolism-associated CXXCW motif protein